MKQFWHDFKYGAWQALKWVPLMIIGSCVFFGWLYGMLWIPWEGVPAITRHFGWPFAVQVVMQVVAAIAELSISVGVIVALEMHRWRR